MTGPRKVFRIEEMAAVRPDTPIEEPPAPGYADIMNELAALRAMLAGAPPQPGGQAPAGQQHQIKRLAAELRVIQSAIAGTKQEHGGRGSPPPALSAARIVGELEAVVTTSEQAAQKILAAAEDIDQAANNLSAALKGDIEQGLAQDIRDRVIQIFEACNYQDLAAQRAAKVMAALGRIERQIARALRDLARAEPAPPAHGPPLPNDLGHVTQSDVDSMFEAEVKSA